MIELSLEQFLETPGLIIDVRSPGEFLQGKIPTALNLPILDNDARKAVGTAYKHEGRNQAVELAFRLVGPNIADFIGSAKTLLSQSEVSLAKIHCWRGGMRSSSAAWFLNTAGIKTATLKGGYKAFRRYALGVLEQLEGYEFQILGGLTGSGKTAILHEMKRLGEQVIDLEMIANHKGSSFGMIGMPSQPTVEQFENELAAQLTQMDKKRPIWLEDESRMIGACKIPDTFFKKMRQSKVIVVENPIAERLERLYQEYGTVDRAEFIDAIMRISRHLGGAQTQEIVALVHSGDMFQAIEKILKYYDATYQFSLYKQERQIVSIAGQGLLPCQWAMKILEVGFA